VIAFGADFLGTWNSPVAQSVDYGAMRQGHPQTRGKLVQVEQRMSLTGANADEWVPARPGTEGVVALGLAHVIVTNKLRPALSKVEGTGDGRGAHRWLVGRVDGVHARTRRADDRRPGKAARAPGARTGGVCAGCRDRRRRSARAYQRVVHGACRERAQRAARRRGSAGRDVLRSRGVALAGHEPALGGRWPGARP